MLKTELLLQMNGQVMNELVAEENIEEIQVITPLAVHVELLSIQNKSTSTSPPKKRGGGIMCTKSDRRKMLLAIKQHKAGPSTSSAVLAFEQPEI